MSQEPAWNCFGITELDKGQKCFHRILSQPVFVFNPEFYRELFKNS